MTNPTAGAPYTGAPALPTETADLANLRNTIRDKDLTPPHPLIRQHLLRQAAYWHRTTLQDPHVSPTRAYDTAWQLAEYDRRHGTWTGGYSPASATWTGEDGALHYVHWEWRHWKAQENPNSPGDIQA